MPCKDNFRATAQVENKLIIIIKIQWVLHNSQIFDIKIKYLIHTFSILMKKFWSTKLQQ